jgi:integrase
MTLKQAGGIVINWPIFFAEYEGRGKNKLSRIRYLLRVFPGRFGGHKTIQNNRALEAAFQRARVTDVSSHNLRKTFATRLLSRGAAITDVQHLLGHATVKTTEKAYAAFVKNERFKQTIDLLDAPKEPMLTVVK